MKSGIWAAITNVVDRGLQLGKLVILANLLTPADFGLMGIALLTLAAFRRFSKLGLNAALIQREETDIDHLLNTAWVMKLGRGVVIGGIAFFVAPYAARFFGEPRAVDIIRVIALSPILLGLQNPGLVYLRKDLQFHKQFLYQFSGTVVSVGVAIGYGFLYRDVWALVFGYIAGDVVKALVSYLIDEYRPRLTFDVDTAKELFGYGKWLTASSIVIFLVTQGDDAFIGWFLGATALGFYQLAYRFSNAPATEITQVISSVTFPTYSRLQTEDSRVTDGFFRTITLISAISFPIAAGIVVVTPYFVRVFLGEQWIPAIIPMQVLAIFGASRSLGAATGPLYQAIGRPDVDTKLATAHVLLLAPTIYMATSRMELTGAAIAIVGVHLLVTSIDTYVATTFLDISYTTFLHRITFPLMASLAMIGGLTLMTTHPLLEGNLPAIVILVPSGIVIYLAFMLVMNQYLAYPIDETIGTIQGAFD